MASAAIFSAVALMPGVVPSVMAGASAICCRLAVSSLVATIALACRLALASATVRKALALEGSKDAEIAAAGDRSRSAISAPRGSDSTAAIDPGRGPMPKRCRASTASAFAELLIASPRRWGGWRTCHCRRAASEKATSRSVTVCSTSRRGAQAAAARRKMPDMASARRRNPPQDVPENAVLQLKRSRAVILIVSCGHRDNEIELRDDANRLPATTKRANPVDLTPTEQRAAEPP